MPPTREKSRARGRDLKKISHRSPTKSFKKYDYAPSQNLTKNNTSFPYEALKEISLRSSIKLTKSKTTFPHASCNQNITTFLHKSVLQMSHHSPAKP